MKKIATAKKQKTDFSKDREVETIINLLVSRRFDLFESRDQLCTLNLPNEVITVSATQLMYILDVLALGRETIGVHRMADRLGKTLPKIK